jgi:hypothetical protein
VNERASWKNLNWVRVISFAYVFSVLALTIEILIRRWWYHQIPPQIPVYLVYSLIGVNFLVAGYLTFEVILGPTRARRNEKEPDVP